MLVGTWCSRKDEKDCVCVEREREKIYRVYILNIFNIFSFNLNVCVCSCGPKVDFRNQPPVPLFNDQGLPVKPRTSCYLPSQLVLQTLSLCLPKLDLEAGCHPYPELTGIQTPQCSQGEHLTTQVLDHSRLPSSSHFPSHSRLPNLSHPPPLALLSCFCIMKIVVFHSDRWF